MVGEYTLPEFRHQLKIFRLRLGTNEPASADNILSDDLPGSWDTARLRALAETLRVVLDGHLTWAGTQELIEREILPAEWAGSLMAFADNHWCPDLLMTLLGWVTRRPTERRTFEQWIHHRNIKTAIVLGRRPYSGASKGWEICYAVERALTGVLGGMRLSRSIPYNNSKESGTPEGEMSEEQRGMIWVFEEVGNYLREKKSRKYLHAYCNSGKGRTDVIAARFTRAFYGPSFTTDRDFKQPIDVSDSSDDDAETGSG
ncbi:uncharacterized protein B0H18DRAFT_956770 [Fomitopsis serialis]|uniref:uncharacterized protein n=1 Tax=Fomitopsis serialis TaxID=139415 RepID=UPI002007E06B|nr:uncharacterized protein B0H18DRAFT_956770 [Neoantrodia serialis]KAH9920999.1 hypothetical protein B0H18DRAFT_956770 [Neoantrodia serialis]